MNHSKHRPDIDTEDTINNQKALRVDLQRLVPRQSVVLDVGANRGQFAKMLIEITPVTRVFCFEPVKEAYEAVKVLSTKYIEILAIRQAVCVEDGTRMFYVTKSDIGSSLLKPIADQPSEWLTPSTQYAVDTVRLDSFIQRLSVEERSNISLLKSDAQGTDLDVLRSAGDYLTPNVIKSVLVEMNFHEFYHNQCTYGEIILLLDKAGYKLARLYPYRAHDNWLWWADALFIGK